MHKLIRTTGTVLAAAAIAACIAPAAGAAPASNTFASRRVSPNVVAPTGRGDGPNDGYSYGYGYGYGSGSSSSSYGAQDPWSDADAGNYGECDQNPRPPFCDSPY